MAVTMSMPELYLSIPLPCDYLCGNTMRMLFVPPHRDLSRRCYSRLVAKGFRRSGRLVYRPHCPSCSACIPARIRAASFQPDRSQRRCWKRNSDLHITVHSSLEFRPEHYDLYLRYLDARHPESSMRESKPQEHMDFLTCGWSETLSYEFRLGDVLLAVAVVDLLDDGLSAVYTFFDPDQSRRGLGTFAILHELTQVQRMGLNWLYLGYWIEQCDKMVYKSRFRPLEIYHADQWRTFLPDRPHQYPIVS